MIESKLNSAIDELSGPLYLYKISGMAKCGPTDQFVWPSLDLATKHHMS